MLTHHTGHQGNLPDIDTSPDEFFPLSLGFLCSFPSNFLICSPTPSASHCMHRPIPYSQSLRHSEQGVNVHFQTYTSAAKAQEELLPGAVWDSSCPVHSHHPAEPSIHPIAAPCRTAMPCKAIPEGSSDFKYSSYKDCDCKYCNKQAGRLERLAELRGVPCSISRGQDQRRHHTGAGMADPALSLALPTGFGVLKRDIFAEFCFFHNDYYLYVCKQPGFYNLCWFPRH